ncbi:TPA: hypothetical protein ACPP4X_001891 [Haemophilus influenzae]
MERLVPLETLIKLIFNSADLARKLAYISKNTVPPPVAEILDKNRIGSGFAGAVFSFGFNLNSTLAPLPTLNFISPLSP